MAWPEKLRHLFQPRKSSQDSALYDGETGRERVIAILRENPVVDGQGEVAATLYDRGAFQGFSKGEDLILQGANDDDVYFLLFGEVDILIDKKWRAKRVAPNQVGEMAALDAGMPRSATVRAKTDAVYAWKVPAQNFNELFVADGKAALRIRRELSSRHREQLAWKPARDGLKSFALWTVISLLVAVLCAAIAWTTTAFLPFGERADRNHWRNGTSIFHIHDAAKPGVFMAQVDFVCAVGMGRVVRDGLDYRRQDEKRIRGNRGVFGVKRTGPRLDHSDTHRNRVGSADWNLCSFRAQKNGGLKCDNQMVPRTLFRGQCNKESRVA